jgi:hypothetical protein
MPVLDDSFNVVQGGHQAKLHLPGIMYDPNVDQAEFSADRALMRTSSPIPISTFALVNHPLDSVMPRNSRRPDRILLLGILLCAVFAALWLLAPRILAHLH